MPTRKWGSEKLVNTIKLGVQDSSAVTALAGGGFVVVWEDESGPNTVIRGQRFDPSGNRVGAEFPISKSPENDQELPSVTALANGGFYVTWTQTVGPDNYILGSVYNSNGALVRNQPVILADGQDTDSNAAQLGAGSVVAWRDPDGDQGEINFRIFDAAGSGGAVLVANTTTAGEQANPAVGSNPAGDRIAIAWTTDYGTVVGRLFNSNGTEAVPEFQIASAEIATELQVVWLNDYAFAATWRIFTGDEDNDEIYMRIFDGHSSYAFPLTDKIRVNSTVAGGQFDPAIAALPNGGFAVAYWDESETGVDDSSWSIRLQAFDPSGGKIGGEVVVNTSTGGHQSQPSLAALPDGRVVVTWTDQVGANDSEIRSQIIDPRDGIVTGTGRSETLYGHDLVNDEISAGAGNDFLIGMRGDDALYGGDGNDSLRGALGADYIDGGDGIDTLNYAESRAAVVVNLPTGLASGGSASGDEFLSVEGVFGSGFNDRLTGNSAANTLNGLGGADRMAGGLGNDTLRGFAGNDTFRFDTKLNATTNVDRILYFDVDQPGTADSFDTIQLENAIFARLTATGDLQASRFAKVADATAADNGSTITYVSSTGRLYYDTNGSVAGGATHFATLGTGLALTNADFYVT